MKFLIHFAVPAAVAGVMLLAGTAAAQDDDGVEAGSSWNIDWDRIDEETAGWSLSEYLDSPIEFGGWFAGGITTNGHGNRTGHGNAPMAINNVADGPVFNQFWFYAEKPLDFECTDVDWGFRVDYTFGADGPDAQAVGDQGWDFGWNSSRDYGSAIPELYLQAGTHDLKILAGYFIGLQGFEAAQAVDNFFYSHNYGASYGVPGTHSGVLANYRISDTLLVDAGWASGWNSSWSNYLSASMFIGGFAWIPSEQVIVTYHLSAGDFGDGTAKNGALSDAGRLYAHAIVFSYEFSRSGTYVLENTLGSNTGLGPQNNRWVSITNYLFYELNEQWDAGVRFEWFRDEAGQRVAVNGSGPGSFYEATAGINWKPHPNVTVRPELRWDWFVGRGRPFDSRDGGVSGTSSHQFTFGVDGILTF